MIGGGSTVTRPEFELHGSTDREGGYDVHGSQYNVICGC